MGLNSGLQEKGDKVRVKIPKKKLASEEPRTSAGVSEQQPGPGGTQPGALTWLRNERTDWPGWSDSFMKRVVASTGKSKCYMDICAALEFLKTPAIHKVKLRDV